MQLLTINEAAQTAGKSIQTIRRMIKQKKIQVKRQKTPQGFNYMIVKDTLDDLLKKDIQTSTQIPLDTQDDGREHRSLKDHFEDMFKTELDRFNMTIQKLIEQNEHDKENFFQLIKTFQDRNAVLENKVKLLEAPRPRWWQIFQ